MQTVSFSNPYNSFDTAVQYGVAESQIDVNQQLFSEGEGLIVMENVNFGQEEVHSEVALAAGSFNLETSEITYSQNIYNKMYPASTTKIMTCYLALEYGNLEDYVTISAHAADQPSDASTCRLKEGDVVSLRDLLYGLMLISGNDAAIAIAEHISGSEEAFVTLMNEEAVKIGASCTNYMNPHGMPDENHYTSVYDLYVIFRHAIENEEFVDIIETKKYTATVTDKNGNAKEREWENSNRFLNGKADEPEGITVIGGKTGTTQAAGYCLVLLSKNELNQNIVSVVMKAGGVSDLYLLTREILQEFNK